MRKCKTCSKRAGPRAKLFCDYHAGYNAAKRVRRTKTERDAIANLRRKQKDLQNWLKKREDDRLRLAWEADQASRSEEGRQARERAAARKAECLAEFMEKREAEHKRGAE